MKHCGNCVMWTPNRGLTQFPDDSHCLRTEAVTVEVDSCERHVSPDSTEANVPQHTPEGISMENNPNPVGPVEILIVTYSKDFQWLEQCLALCRKYLTGFQGITVAHPDHEASIFTPLVERYGVRLHAYREAAGKGMLHHMAKMAQADSIVPTSTRYVLHLDADCMFHTPTTPEAYFWDDKPVYLYRTWESLASPDPRNPSQRVVSDCYQWKPFTDAQIGIDTKAYTMTRHPTLFPMEFYSPYRQRVSELHHMPFEDYMLSGQRNAHPQDRMDFTAMGAFAFHFMPQMFHWIDVATGIYPKDRLKAFWSHGGITEQIGNEIRSFHRYIPTPAEEARMKE